MSADATPVDKQRQKISEFMQLLPLTLAIAGLPQSETGRFLNEGQMEVRATALRNAFKIARQMLLEIGR